MNILIKFITISSWFLVIFAALIFTLLCANNYYLKTSRTYRLVQLSKYGNQNPMYINRKLAIAAVFAFIWLVCIYS